MPSLADSAVRLRWAAFLAAIAITALSAWLFSLQARAEGWPQLEILRLGLSSVCVFWLAWGAAGTLLGAVSAVQPQAPKTRSDALGRTAIVMPIYHEDPPSTFARVAAMSARLSAGGVHGHFDIFILSDSQSIEAAASEALWFERLLGACVARDQVFYRRRDRNIARKAGNIEDFIRRSGGAYTYALVLDADSLMDASAILAMVEQMDADPRLGLLQSLPRLIEARSIFGAAMQFASHVYAPTHARGSARMHGAEGPYWGHNAIFRLTAFAQSCGLPELRGKPPFGGHILSHDYVEAALLARNGWRVRLDSELPGSFEEGPESIVEFAKRDQRWCQGNLQHSRILLAPGLKFWSRATLFQGILSYLMPALWLLLLGVSVTAADVATERHGHRGPDWAAWALMGFVAAMLIGPKILAALATRPAMPLWRLARDMLAELLLSTLIAPVILLFQLRALLRVLSGRDGGWPPNQRGSAVVSVRDAWRASWWITCTGGAVLAALLLLAPDVSPWGLPVALPMLAAPLLISWTSRPLTGSLWQLPIEAAPGVRAEWHAIKGRWLGTNDPQISSQIAEGVPDVLGQ